MNEINGEGGSSWNGVDRRREKQRKGERRKHNWRDVQKKGERRFGVERRKSERRKSAKEKRQSAIFSDLKKKLLIYFLLVVFVCIAITVELIIEVGEPKLTDQITEIIMVQAEEHTALDAVAGFNFESIYEPLNHLQIRMIIVLGIVLAAVFLTLFFFIKDVAGPLDEMVQTAKEISRGNLAKTVPVYTKDEIGQLGGIINDITADFQEVLLMVGKISLSAADATDVIHNRVEVLKEKQISDEIQQQLNVLYKDIRELKSLVESFSFYQIDLDKL
ncbi:MAG: HAMP domain-containing protein [Deltaproteobacteria bacterium]|nr:HAMP domain-containing protein [Candidatus Zymogenaceae bacterium]